MTLAVVGTDTGVGKTLISALLLTRFGAELPLAYWKPVATGSRTERDVDTVRALAGHRGEVLEEEVLLPEPLSPHLAARLAGRAIDPDRLAVAWGRSLRQQEAAGGALIVEGAGGLLVPLTEAPGETGGTLLIDLLEHLEAPCLVVGRSGLGTINHTLLSLEALAARGLPVAGVVLSGPPEPENRRAIERFGQARVSGPLRVEEVPVLEVPDGHPTTWTPAATERARKALETAAGAFDPSGRLMPWLRASADPFEPPEDRSDRLGDAAEGGEAGPDGEGPAD